MSATTTTAVRCRRACRTDNLYGLVVPQLIQTRRARFGREDVGSASGSGPASAVLVWYGRRVGSLGPGLTSESADAARAVLRDDLSAGPRSMAPASGADLICLAWEEAGVHSSGGQRARAIPSPEKRDGIDHRRDTHHHRRRGHPRGRARRCGAGSGRQTCLNSRPARTDTEEVTGSNPVRPTRSKRRCPRVTGSAALQSVGLRAHGRELSDGILVRACFRFLIHIETAGCLVHGVQEGGAVAAAGRAVGTCRRAQPAG